MLLYNVTMAASWQGAKSQLNLREVPLGRVGVIFSCRLRDLPFAYTLGLVPNPPRRSSAESSSLEVRSMIGVLVRGCSPRLLGLVDFEYVRFGDVLKVASEPALLFAFESGARCG